MPNLVTDVGSYLRKAATGFVQTFVPKEKEKPQSPLRSDEANVSGATLSDGRTVEAGSQAPEFGNMLNAWMQADPKTLAGLQSFLATEFSHYSTDPQRFQTLQLITMLKEARELLEGQELKNSSKNLESRGASEEAERAVLGASLMGYAHYLLRRKNLKDRASIDFNVGIESDSESPALSFCLGEVVDFLKKAEAGLHRAMVQGADDRRLRILIHRILDICADILQMQRELAK